MLNKANSEFNIEQGTRINDSLLLLNIYLLSLSPAASTIVVIASPVIILAMLIIGSAYISSVKIIPVVIPAPIDVTIRVPVIVASIRIPRYHEARTATKDQ